MAHEAFDPDPISELPADEPQTPLWLPAVGALLFVIVGIWWGTGNDAETKPAGEAAKTVTTAAAAAPPAAAPAGQQPQRPPTDPAKLAEMRKRIEQMRAKGQLPRPGEQKSPPKGQPDGRRKGAGK